MRLGRPQNDLVTVRGWCDCIHPNPNSCTSPLSSLSLTPAPYISVSLPLSSVISVWCILAPVVGSLFSMWVGLISVLWWKMQRQSYLLLQNEYPDEPNTPGSTSEICVEEAETFLKCGPFCFFNLVLLLQPHKHPHGPDSSWHMAQSCIFQFGDFNLSATYTWAAVVLMMSEAI